VTLTAIVDAVVALTLTLAGTIQAAPVGAPLQVTDAVPANPPPPMTRAKLAIPPAETVAELEPPEDTPRSRLGVTPTPERATVAGPPPVLLVTVRLPVSVPAEAGAKLIPIWHEFAGASEVPQLFDSVKFAETEICAMLKVAFPVLLRVTF